MGRRKAWEPGREGRKKSNGCDRGVIGTERTARGGGQGQKSSGVSLRMARTGARLGELGRERWDCFKLVFPAWTWRYL